MSKFFKKNAKGNRERGSKGKRGGGEGLGCDEQGRVQRGGERGREGMISPLSWKLQIQAQDVSGAGFF